MSDSKKGCLMEKMMAQMLDILMVSEMVDLMGLTNLLWLEGLMEL